jgi:hypothetical protein
MQVSSYLFQSPYSQAVQVGRPDPVQEQKQATEEQSEKSKDKDNLVEQQSSSSQNDAVGISVKSSAMYQNEISSKSTSEAVNTMIAVAKDAGRSENIKAYVNN